MPIFLRGFKNVKGYRVKQLNRYHLYFIILFISVMFFFFMILMANWHQYNKQYIKCLKYSTIFNGCNDNAKTINISVTDTVDPKEYMIKEDGTNHNPQATIDDSKQSSFAHILLTSTKNKDTLQDPSFLTIYCNKGRLGNQMSTYATLLGLSDLNNRTPYSPKCNMIHLRPYFHVTATEIDELPKNLIKEYPIDRYFHPEDGHIPIDKNVLSGHKTPNSFTFYNHIRNKLKQEFQFREHILSYVQAFFSSLKELYPAVIFVGVHVRRTDYFLLLRKYGRREANSQYFIKAMKYFRTKYNNVIFVVVSDDRNWCKKYLGKSKDVIVAPDPPKPAYDMALLTQCNHTIIAYGSFGFWSAYLSDGETVYFAEYLSSNPTLSKKDTPYNKTYPSNWIGLKIHD